MYYPDSQDHLWMSGLPWEKVIISPKRTFLAIACPPIVPPNAFPPLFPTYFCLDIPCSSCLFEQGIIRDSLGLRGCRFINTVLTPVGSKTKLPVEI